MKLNKIYPTFLLFLVIIFFVGCSDDKNLSLEQKLQNVLDHKIEEFSTNGVSAAVIFSENKKWMGSSGISHDTVTVKTDMVFAIGSVTKNFVATLTLKFVEEGKLSLEDPLSKWLPEYRYINKDITIRQLLNHTSGIYMFWSNQKIWDDLKKDKSKIWTPKEVLTYIKEPYFEPGEGFRYSNTNYLLLAMIITKATNSTLSSNFKEYFWQPLNIKSARLSMEEKIPDNQAHVYGDDPYYDMTYKPREAHESITYGSSGIFMTAMDLASWCHTLFEGKILKQQSMDEMFEFVNLRARNNMSTYGLGVQLYSKKLTNGKKAYGHSGANIGTSTYMIYLPKNHLSVVVMINSMDHRCTKSILKDLIKISLKEMNDYSIIPIFHYGPIIISAATFWLIYIIVYVRKKRKRKIRSDNSMIQG